MRKHIIITVILLVVTAYVTVVYFKNLNPPGTHTSRVMSAIPDNASLIFEFNNDQSFYDIFKDNKLFGAIVGKDALGDLDTLRLTVLQNPTLSKFLTGQNLFISLHPTTSKNIALLFTISAAKGFGPQVINALSKQPNTGLLITPEQFAGKQGYSIFISILKKRFYLISKDDNTLMGSFSKELVDQGSIYKPKKNQPSFILLSDQQNANSLANLYVNYAQLNPLFDILFKNKNTDIFKSFRLLSSFGALSLNYKTDALMFNGTTSSLKQPVAYLNLFANQRPIINHLKDLFPSTTAYATNFAVSDPGKFGKDLQQWYNNAGLKGEREKLLRQIKIETGTDMQASFNGLLGNEFAEITTRYFEKLAIVSIKDGAKMNTLLTGISKTTEANTGQFSYDKLPFFLLGDAFAVFRHPYYLIIDNYLILANSPGELKSYNDSYLNRKFLSKNGQYQQFDNLLAGQSNVAFLIVFKNAQPIFKRDLNDEFFDDSQAVNMGWGDFYGASWQLSVVDKNFDTNFSLRLNTDTLLTKN